MDAEQMIAFARSVHPLKSTFRYMETIPGRKESTAEHSWRLALFTHLTMTELGFQKDAILHAITIALVHDLPEAKTGDIDALLIYNGTIKKEDKHQNEKRAIQEIASTLSSPIKESVIALWNEYEMGKTKEARIVKALDKIETLLHVIDGHLEAINDPGFTAHYADTAVSQCPELIPLLLVVKRELQKRYTSLECVWKNEYSIILDK